MSLLFPTPHLPPMLTVGTFQILKVFSEKLLKLLRTFQEEQLAEQFGYFNFSLYLVISKAEQIYWLPQPSIKRIA